MKKRNPDMPGPPQRRLSATQRRIRQYLEDFIQGRGYSPSLREIAAAVGLASTSTVSYHLDVLREMGLVDWETGRRRTIKVRPLSDHADFQSARPSARVPMMGVITAGIPVTAPPTVQGEDFLDLPKILTGEGDFIGLSVRGDSMTGAAIADGDWVVVRRAPDAENGDIVAAMLDSATSDGAEATVKTLRKQDGHVWLMPQNPAYAPIPGDDATLIGKVVTVLRRV